MQPAGRLRLRMWLEEQIESGKYPGVCWIDKTERVFQIPWKHAARHGWSIDRDATLFRSWAEHTGLRLPIQRFKKHQSIRALAQVDASPQLWQPPSCASSTQDMSFSVPIQDMSWEAMEQEDGSKLSQENAPDLQKLVGQCSTTAEPCDHTCAHRGWRAYPLWDHWHCPVDESLFSLHIDNSNELLEVSDWSLHQQTLTL